MPGRLRTSFRSGNLTEDLGLLLLKGIAAIADVPRAEDVGLDAVATLLRRDTDGNCYAEDGFVVQLKSASAMSLEYRDHELSWFLGQSQPMFIGLVSKKDASIALYSTLYANQACLALHARRITILFGKSESAYPWAGGAEGSATVWLGPPVLSWALAEMDKPAWSAATYTTLKRFLGIARREFALLSLGQSSKLEWSTNDEQSIQSPHVSMMKGCPDGIQALADKCIPGVSALLLHAMSLPDGRGDPLTISLIGVVENLRDLNVNVDESAGALVKMSLLSMVSRRSGQGGQGVATKEDRDRGGPQTRLGPNSVSLGERGEQSE